MTDDIVVRLGHITADDEYCHCLKCDAAAEIERLRALVRELEAALPDPPPQHGALVGSKRLTTQPNKEARRG